MTLVKPATPRRDRAASSGRGRRARSALRSLRRWLLVPALTVFVASFVIYVALSLAPGDPVAALLGPRPSAARVAAERQRLGLDQSVLERYWHWLVDALQGNFGDSFVFRTPVTSLVGARVTTTLLLVAFAGIIVVVFGLLFGIVGAVVKPLGPVVAALSGLGIAIPSYVAAFALVAFFALDLGWFPALGGGTGFADQLWHLTLPAIALALGWAAYLTQITRTALREEQHSEHVATARGRGIGSVAGFRRHVLRNASVSIVTAVGLTFAGLVAGTVVVEQAFGLDGLGSFLVSSVSSKDYNVVVMISMIFVVAFVVVMTGVDLVNSRIDPRLREPGARS